LELESEQRRYTESEKNLKKEDKRSKDLATQGDEDRKSFERAQSQVESLQQKIKVLKRQVEEAVSSSILSA